MEIQAQQNTVGRVAANTALALPRGFLNVAGKTFEIIADGSVYLGLPLGMFLMADGFMFGTAEAKLGSMSWSSPLPKRTILATILQPNGIIEHPVEPYELPVGAFLTVASTVMAFASTQLAKICRSAADSIPTA